MKDAYYFSHDSNARNDEKILMLRAYHGWEGYGIYWALIEMMFESSDAALYHSKIKGIAVSYNIDITLLENVINTCIAEGLFESDDEIFWSESLRRRKNKYHEIKKKRSEAGRKGMAKRWGSDNSDIADDNNSNNTVITKDNKVKESKVKESKVKEIYMDYVQLTPDEYTNLLNKLSTTERDNYIERLNDYIGQIGLSKANKQYKSHYHTILNWHRRDNPNNNNTEGKEYKDENPFINRG